MWMGELSLLCHNCKPMGTKHQCSLVSLGGRLYFCVENVHSPGVIVHILKALDVHKQRSAPQYWPEWIHININQKHININQKHKNCLRHHRLVLQTVIRHCGHCSCHWGLGSPQRAGCSWLQYRPEKEHHHHHRHWIHHTPGFAHDPQEHYPLVVVLAWENHYHQRHHHHHEAQDTFKTGSTIFQALDIHRNSTPWY